MIVSKSRLRVRSQKSFTLIELMVTVGVLAITLTITSGILIAIVKSYQKQAQIQKIERNGDLAIRTITEKLRKAMSVSVNGNNISTITMINNVPVSENIGVSNNNVSGACSFAYVVQGNVPNPILDNAKITDDSTVTGVDISSAVFTATSSGDNTYVDVTLNVTPCGATAPVRTFSNMVTLRGTY